MINLIVNPLPDTVSLADGREIPINVDFRASIQVFALLESPIDDQAKEAGVLLQYFGPTFPELILNLSANGKELLDAALSFARMDELNELLKQPHASRERTFDWDEDQYRVISDFQREYGLDLTDPSLQMHWWRFRTLFNGLTEDSLTKTAIGWRAAKPPKNANKAEQERYQAMKKIYRLPPRSAEEVLERDRAIWGD